MTRFRVHRRLPWLAMGWVIGAMVLACPSTGRASSVDSTKIFTWTMSAAPQAPAKNEYHWGLWAEAEQAPNPRDKRTDPTPLGVASGEFDATMALSPAVTKTSGLAVSGGASAQISTELSASAPTAVLGGLVEVQASVRTTGQTTTPAGSETWISGSGGFKIKGGTITGAKIIEPGKGFRAVRSGALTTSGRYFLRKGSWFDPVVLSIMNEDDTLLAEQELASFNSEYNFDGTVTWDSAGVVLESPIDGQSYATMGIDMGNSDGAGNYLDSWVTGDTGLSTVSLANGIFSATGLFSTLPWAFDSPTSPTQASLAPGVLEAIEAGYQIPSSLVSLSSYYYEVMSFDEGATLNESQMVPTPGACAMGAAGLGLLAVLRRRWKEEDITHWRKQKRVMSAF